MGHRQVLLVGTKGASKGSEEDIRRFSENA
jgi:hypothetical protein